MLVAAASLPISAHHVHLLTQSVQEVSYWWNYLDDLFGQHLRILVGFGLALLVVGRLMIEKRNPSNIYAWGMVILFIPWLGVPLYLMFGGRKVRKLVRTKQEVNAFAAQLSAGVGGTTSLTVDSDAPIQPRRKFTGNSFRLVGDGVAGYRVLREEIARAKQSIHLQTFIFGRDEPARDILNDLVAKAREGVEVKLLLDALGSLGATGHFLQPLRAAGGRTARFMRVIPLQTKWSANLRNHRKFMVIDRERALVGGQNIDARFIDSHDTPKLFHDFGAVIAGPAVSAFNRNFVSDWCFATKDSPRDFHDLLAYLPQPCGNDEVEVMTSGPDVLGDPLWERLLILVQQCKRELTIVTPYFVPDEVLFRSMIVQAHTGKKIRLIMPEKSNHPLTDFARNYYLRLLNEAGVEILFYTPKMLHAKLVLVDGETALIGSANLDLRSLFVNFEIGVFLYTPDTIKQLTTWMESLLPNCATYADTGRAAASANRRVMEDFAHLLGPLL